MFEKNLDFLKPEDTGKIENTRIGIVGTGALGQMVAHILTRSGFKNFVLMDPDQMEYSNFNRQLYAVKTSLNRYKAEVLEEGLKEIQPDIMTKVCLEYLNASNGIECMAGCHILVDCVDHVPTKLYMEQLAEQLDIPLIHGAVEGWYGQVSTIFPRDHVLERLYSNAKKQEVAALMVTVNMIASFQAAEVIKVVTGCSDILRHKVMFVDLLTNDFSCINLSLD